MLRIDDFTEEKECVYKGEHYSVRDNGAVMRHQRAGRHKRKLDDVWSFGTPNIATGYLDFCGERVHRIVATAFHGSAPTEQHVVDHIDTNKKNNRPDNLRWLTRLENTLNNEITRKKVELICGSIEAFLANPSLLYGYETEDKNFSWMRSVTPEEAKNCLENWSHWSKTAKPSPDFKRKESRIGAWIYRKPMPHDNTFDIGEDNPFMNSIPDGSGGYRTVDPSIYVNDIHKDEQEEKRTPLKVKSLTSNAIQINWKNPVAFPCCPQEFTGNPLEAYMENLQKGSLFSTNSLGDSTILRFGMTDSENLWVMCRISIGWKTHAFTKITFKDELFYHENMGVFDIGDEPEEMFESLLKGTLEL